MPGTLHSIWYINNTIQAFFVPFGTILVFSSSNACTHTARATRGVRRFLWPESPIHPLDLPYYMTGIQRDSDDMTNRLPLTILSLKIRYLLKAGSISTLRHCSYIAISFTVSNRTSETALLLPTPLNTIDYKLHMFPCCFVRDQPLVLKLTLNLRVLHSITICKFHVILYWYINRYSFLNVWQCNEN